MTRPVAAAVVVENDIDALARHASDVAAEAIGQSIERRGAANVMFASGDSQLRFLAELTVRSDVDWARVTGFHMDEYLAMPGTDPNSFARYMHERIIDPARPGSFHLIDGAAPDPDAECRRYGDLLAGHPLDLCCLGIGENGHLAFNDPPVADFVDPQVVKVVALDDACKRQQVGEGHFPTIDAVPPRAMTVTIPTLVSAQRVLVIVPESRKAVAVRDALEGPVTTACPASILQQIANAVVYLDRESAALLTIHR